MRLVDRVKQHFDPTITHELRIAERARLDAGSLHSIGDERLTNSANTAVGQLLVARIGTARIHGAVDSHFERGIPLEVFGHIGRLAFVDSLEVGVVVIEPEVPSPMTPWAPVAPLRPAGPVGPTKVGPWAPVNPVSPCAPAGPTAPLAPV